MGYGCRPALPLAGCLLALLLAGCEGEGEKREAPDQPGADSLEDRAGRVLLAKKLKQAPDIDGQAEPLWDALPGVELIAFHEAEETPITLKACHDGKTLYLLAVWKDLDASVEHKPWTWDEPQAKYIAGKEREDRLALEFAMSKTFDECMMGGTPYVADIWHWKACRTNPSGAVDEEWHKVALDPFDVDGMEAISYANQGRDEETTLYMLRVKDKGAVAFKELKPPAGKGEARLPAFAPQTPDSGQADVKAKGAWKDGRWTLEFARALKASRPDEDVTLKPGGHYFFAVAVFDKVSDEKHHTTPRGRLVLEK
ncbi:MAG: ethylbenzene dehydrogenase-related protein [Planctomycetota bacterium]|nr:ethylbenzene dehydrogenase-related protein [Planctomycetota bacterium]